MNEIRCSMCYFSTNRFNEYRSHIVRIHKNDPNFVVHCCIDSCAYSTKKWSSYRSHISRKHRMLLQDRLTLVNEEGDDNENNAEVEVGHVYNEDGLAKQTANTAAYTLAFEANHDVPRQAVDDFVDTTRAIVKSNVTRVLEKLREGNIVTGIADSTVQEIDQSFESLNTSYKRNKFYSEKFGYIEPEEVYLGSVSKTINGISTRKRKFGYIIPFQKNLKDFLELPEIWQYVQNSHRSNDAINRDFCDGNFATEHPLLQRNHKALQIVIYTDDMEIVNPLGAHVKKHKITVFYFTLCNIPPEFRSQLHAIQLLAIAKTTDIKKFGPKRLLRDFVETMNELSQGGIEMFLHGSMHKIEGLLVYVPADTPASNWLGGFKEGVSFSYKICRTCNVSSGDLKRSFKEINFTLRDYALHKQRCEILASLDKNGRQHFSKVWGIKERSVLCDLADFDLCLGLVHDPMHIFLEGIVRLELQVVLFHLIFNQKTFTLAWLNHQLKTFTYSYLQVKNKPESIERKQILGVSPFRQTAAAMITLCEVLPHIVGPRTKDSDKKWLNFLRLVQITLISTSPISDESTAGMLCQLIITHHTEFVRLYPKSNVTPKMHYCIHLVRQMQNFGPLRHLWCMRFEGKHGFFKTKKWKCFKNLPLSMAKKHQMYMCHKQTMTDGSKNPNFLYKGDIVKEGVEQNFCDIYPDLLESFSSVCREDNVVDDMTVVYTTESFEIHGLQYKNGCILLLEVVEWVPQFAICRGLFIYNDRKFFIVEKLETDCFIPKLLSYKIQIQGVKSVVAQSQMTFKWPLWPHTVGDDMYVINKYPFFTEYF